MQNDQNSVRAITGTRQTKQGLKILLRVIVVGLASTFIFGQTVYIAPPALAAYSDPSTTSCDNGICISRYRPAVWNQGDVTSFQPRPVSSTKYFFAGAISDVTSSGSVFGFESTSTSPVTFYLGGYNRISTYSPAFNGGIGSYCYRTHLFAKLGGAASVATQDSTVVVAGGAAPMSNSSSGYWEVGGDSSTEPGQGVTHGRDGGFYDCNPGSPGGIQNNSDGSGFMSNPDNLTDLQSCGCAPNLGPFYSGAWAAVYRDIGLGLKVSKASGNSATFNITHNENLDVTKMEKWQITVDDLDSGTSFLVDYAPSVDSGVLQNLEPGKYYSFELAAIVKSTKTFTASDSIQLTDKPQPVIDLHASPSFSDHPSISWTEPYSNGEVIESYLIQRKEEKDAVFSDFATVTTNSAVLDPSEPDSMYTYRVFARNSLGQSDPGTEITYLAASIPSAPNSLQVENVLSSQPHVNWETSTETGTSQISYTLETSEDNKSWITDSTTTGTQIVPAHLVQGKSYYIRVCASNIHGYNCSNSILFHTALPPSKVPYLSHYNGRYGVNQAFDWPASEPNSGGEVSYTFETSLDGQTWSEYSTSTKTEVELRNLIAGQRYYFRVRATNLAGESVSDSTDYLTAVVPDRIESLSVKKNNVNSATFSWYTPESNGSDVTSYIVEMAKGNSAIWTEVLRTANTTATISDLPYKTSLRFRVSATNGAGTSNPSPETVAFSLDQTPPTTPLQFKTLKVSKSELSFSWLPPSNLGGYPVTGFKVSLTCGSATTSKEVTSTVRSATFSNLRTGIPCSSEITASNKLGKSIPSSIKRIVPNPSVVNITVDPVDSLVIPYGGKLTEFQTHSTLVTNGMPFTGKVVGKLYFGGSVIGAVHLNRLDNNDYYTEWLGGKSGISRAGRYTLEITASQGTDSFTKRVELQVKSAPKPPAPKRDLVVSISFSTYTAHVGSRQNITLYVNLYPAVTANCHFYSGNHELGSVHTGSNGAYTTISSSTFISEFVNGNSEVAVNVDCSNSSYEGSDYDYLYLTR